MKGFTLRSTLATGVAALAIAGVGSVAAVAATSSGVTSGSYVQLTAATSTMHAGTVPGSSGSTPARSGPHHCP